MVWAVKNWKQFQHFKDRTPPWVKLYRDILDDPDWHSLSGDVAKTLVMLWVIASEDETKQGLLPNNKKLAFRLRISEKSLQSIVSQLSHWLIQIDITAISEGYQVDAPERAPEETETETEGDREGNSLSGKPDVEPVNGKKKLSEACLEVLTFLNEKTGRNYKPVPANIEMIAARIKDGATIAECRQVIAKKSREWKGDEKMDEYLRPATLFNRTKFAQYQGELG